MTLGGSGKVYALCRTPVPTETPMEVPTENPTEVPTETVCEGEEGNFYKGRAMKILKPIMNACACSELCVAFSGSNGSCAYWMWKEATYECILKDNTISGQIVPTPGIIGGSLVTPTEEPTEDPTEMPTEVPTEVPTPFYTSICGETGATVSGASSSVIPNVPTECVCAQLCQDFVGPPKCKFWTWNIRTLECTLFDENATVGQLNPNVVTGELVPVPTPEPVAAPTPQPIFVCSSIDNKHKCGKQPSCEVVGNICCTAGVPPEQCPVVCEDLKPGECVKAPNHCDWNGKQKDCVPIPDGCSGHRRPNHCNNDRKCQWVGFICCDKPVTADTCAIECDYLTKDQCKTATMFCERDGKNCIDIGTGPVCADNRKSNKCKKDKKNDCCWRGTFCGDKSDDCSVDCESLNKAQCKTVKDICVYKKRKCLDK